MNDPVVDFILATIDNKYRFEILDATTIQNISDDVWDLYTSWFVDEPPPDIKAKFTSDDDFDMIFSFPTHKLVYRMSEDHFPRPQDSEIRLSGDIYELLKTNTIPYIAEVGTDTLLIPNGELSYVVGRTELEIRLGTAEAVHVVLKYGV